MTTQFSPGFIYGGGNGPLVLQYRGAASINNSAVSIQTFAAEAIGAADANRWVFVQWNSKNGTARTLNSVTIGGVTATLEAIDGTHTQTNGMCGIAFANVPAGTTADIVFNWSGAFGATTAQGTGINWYTVVGVLNTTAADTFDSNVNTTPISKTFTVPAGGIALVTGNPNNAGHAVSGDLTTDDNFVQTWAGGAVYAGSYSNPGNVNSSSAAFTATAWSASAALVPIIGRAYGHL